MRNKLFLKILIILTLISFAFFGILLYNFIQVLYLI
jgi:hypothetical protein